MGHSRPSTREGLSNSGDLAWQVVNHIVGETETRPYTAEAQAPAARHRRGRTEGFKRLSMLKSRSRRNTTTADAPMNDHITPSSSFESSNPDHQDEASRPQSVWSDSDHSDSQTKRWVAKGSKMLKKQNSRFNLNSSRIVDWVEEDDDPTGQDSGATSRVHGKPSRMWSTGTGKLPSVIRLSTVD